jgi:hypothetical protein
LLHASDRGLRGIEFINEKRVTRKSGARFSSAFKKLCPNQDGQDSGGDTIPDILFILAILIQTEGDKRFHPCKNTDNEIKSRKIRITGFQREKRYEGKRSPPGPGNDQ